MLLLWFFVFFCPYLAAYHGSHRLASLEMVGEIWMLDEVNTWERYGWAKQGCFGCGGLRETLQGTGVLSGKCLIPLLAFSILGFKESLDQ